MFQKGKTHVNRNYDAWNETRMICLYRFVQKHKFIHNLYILVIVNLDIYKDVFKCHGL